MKILKSSLSFVFVFGMITYVSTIYAAKDPNIDKQKTASINEQLEPRAVCSPGIAEIDQQVNNVRARLSTGGDVWWNRSDGLYIVPKPAEGQRPVSALFAGGVWVGGVDRAGNIKLAGVTYRTLTARYDWYPGPLDEEGATEKDICKNWDRFFTVYANDIARHNIAFENAVTNNVPYDCDSIPANVRYWPGKGNPYWREKYDFDLPNQSLGAFWDQNEDGIYDPCDGDFPNIEIRDCGPENRTKAKELVPDEMIFWIYNDNGGPQRLTAGSAIRMEVQVQAFGYTTNDEVNDMTFQRYKLINKANDDLVDCYFAMWIDPDLGCAADDYVGCDVPRSMAYVYNEDAVDGSNGASCAGGVNTYGSKIPALGIDYFRGPRGPKVYVRNPQTNAIIKDADGTPLLRDPRPQTGEIDTLVELGMSSFIYTNNAGINSPPPATTDPANQDDQFYNNIRGRWKTGDAVTFGGSGFNPGSSDTVRYVFPDEPNKLSGWSMCTAGLPNGDRRTLQATGPLLLQPGATNELIIGVVFVPDIDYPCPDISRLQSADDIAQALFRNCFDITDGPDAPDLCGIELDREIIIAMTNDAKSSNNAFTNYAEIDLKAPETVVDNEYKFEGYKIYQLADAGVSPQELSNIAKARLIYQTDVKNGVAEIFNWKSDPNPLASNQGQPVWSYTRMVSGADAGISTTFKVTEDQFSLKDRNLVNHKPYHFMVLAYAYNNYEDFNPREVIGQRTPYLEGRRNVKVYSFTPRPMVYAKTNSKYGDGIEITRLDGEGNGGNFLDIKDGITDQIIKGEQVKIVYKEGRAPIEVKIFNPLEVSNGKYRLELVGNFNSGNTICALDAGATWKLTDLTTNEVIASESSIDKLNEQIVYRKGFSVKIGQVDEPGIQVKSGNGAVGQEIVVEDPAKNWFNWASLQNNPSRGGFGIPTSIFDPIEPTDPAKSLDPNKFLSNIGAGAFFPFALSRYTAPGADQFPFYLSPAFRDASGQGLLLNTRLGNLVIKDLNNVDIVMTSDKSLWSRCIVVETSSPDYYSTARANTIGGSKMLDIRNQASVDKDGKVEPTEPNGLSWFPGYAIDVETGERLNIFFGENSSYNNVNNSDNNRFLTNRTIATDMIYNPSGQVFSNVNGPVALTVPLGGQHYIYVTRQKYDGCALLRAGLTVGGVFTKKIDPLSLITWTSMSYGSNTVPMLPIEQGLIPTRTTIKLRVDNPFANDRQITAINRAKICETVGKLPAYEFELTGKGIEELKQEEYKGALANVNVVPNPYYAYSAYENNQFVNTIKITNLPDRAIVTIYTLDGKYIRKFDRDERRGVKTGTNPAINASQTVPALEWDMKNAVGIPVGSGVYLIHVVAPNLGEERTLKWFGVNRKFDPTGL